MDRTDFNSPSQREHRLVEAARRQLFGAATFHPNGHLVKGDLFENRWQIIALKGRGGFGEVYQAFDSKPAMQRFVAIKILPAGFLDSSQSHRERFRTELLTTARLSHPHIVTMYDGGEAPGQDGWMVMEFLAGGTMTDLVRELGPQPWKRVVRYAIAVCSALQYLHDEGLVHRDIKPANIMFTGGDREHPKVCDLGIVHTGPRQDGLNLTQPGTQPGTLLWMAPEQVLGEIPTPQTDLFSVAATLYFLLAARSCYPDKTLLNTNLLIDEILNGRILHLKAIAPETPQLLVDLIHQCLAGDHHDRPHSAAVLREALLPLESPASPPCRNPQRFRRTQRADHLEKARQVVRTPLVPRIVYPEDLAQVKFGVGEVIIWGADGAEMIFVPAGPFVMSQNDDHPSESLAHIGAHTYLIDKYPVTNARYKRFIDAIPDYPVPRVDTEWGDAYNWNSDTRTYPPGQDDYPVVMVTQDDAMAYATWARKRLPTETEWEKAASWDPSTNQWRQYPWGNEWDASRANSAERVAGRSFEPIGANDPAYIWFQGFRKLDPREQGSFELLTKVYAYTQGASALGVMDMVGNVHEWCETDLADSRPGGKTASAEVACAKPCRGGAWADHPFYLRTSSHYAVRSERYDRIGFRCLTSLADS